MSQSKVTKYGLLINMLLCLFNILKRKSGDLLFCKDLHAETILIIIPGVCACCLATSDQQQESRESVYLKTINASTHPACCFYTSAFVQIQKNKTKGVEKSFYYYSNYHTGFK